MDKIQSFAITAALALALAFTFSCSSDDGDDNKGSGGGGKGENGSILITETYERDANCDEGKICLIEEQHYEKWCQEDGTLEINSWTNENEYSISNKVLSLEFHDGDIIFDNIKFNGTSDKLEGTWTRSKNKEESCKEYTGEQCIEYDYDTWECLEYITMTYNDCDEGWDYTKAVFTATTAAFTREECFEDMDGYEYRGWIGKAIDCSNFEYSKGNEKLKIKNTSTNEKYEESYTYNNKTCVRTEYRNVTEAKAQQACKSAYDKAKAEGGDASDYYWSIISERDKFIKCVEDNNFPKDFL